MEKYTAISVDSKQLVYCDMQLFEGNIEEVTLHILIKTPQFSTDELISAIRKIRGSVTKQGVYRVLRKLKAEEKVIIYKSKVAINVLWVEKLRSFLSKRSTDSILGNVATLQEGEKISLPVRGLVAIDELWSNLFYTLEANVSKHHPLFLYNLHNWFIFMNEQNEQMHALMIKHKRPTYLSIGGTTSWDKKSISLSKNIGITCSPTNPIKQYDYFCVLGDFIFSIKFSKTTTIAINTAFKKAISGEELQKQLRTINKTAGGRLLIVRHAIKARESKKRLAREFHVPREYRDYV